MIQSEFECTLDKRDEALDANEGDETRDCNQDAISPRKHTRARTRTRTRAYTRARSRACARNAPQEEKNENENETNL